jgi:exo-beta-1,3-glucanase (GH17 family)
LICNTKDKLINQVDLKNFAEEKNRRARSLEKIDSYHHGTQEKVMKEMATQTSKEKSKSKLKNSCSKCINIKNKKKDGSCMGCDQHLKFLDSLLQKFIKIHEHVQNSIFSIQLNLNLINDLLDLAKIE